MANNKNKFEKGGFFRRNWPVLLIGLVALVLLLGAFAYWWWVPRLVHKLVGSLEESVTRLTGASASHEDLSLEGLDRLVLRGFVLGDPRDPLARFESIAVEVDPFVFSDGLPTVLSVEARGVKVNARRLADGTDNFSDFARRLAAHLQKKGGEGGGKVSKLARLLRQTPRVVMKDVSFAVEIAYGEADEPGLVKVFHFDRGEVVAENPNLSSRERGYQIDAMFDEVGGASVLTLNMDVGFSARKVQARAEFSPPLYVELYEQQFELRKVKLRSGEFIEVGLGRVGLANPFADRALLEATLGDVLARFGKKGYLTYLDRFSTLEGEVDRLIGIASANSARLGYPAKAWQAFGASLKKYLASLLRRVLNEARGERLVLDSCRVVYLTGATEGGYAKKTLKVVAGKGAKGALEFTAFLVPATDNVRVDFEVVTPSELLRLSGHAEQDGERLSLNVDLAVNILEPLLQARGGVSLNDGQWTADVTVQANSERPAFAVSGNLLLRDGSWTGDAEGGFVVPGVAVAESVSARVKKNEWSVDLGGLVYLPGRPGEVRVQASLDSRVGIKRFSAASEQDVRVGLGEFDLLVGKIRMGRDSVVHLEEIAITRQGAERSRAVVRLSDLSLELARKGLDLLDAFKGYAEDSDLRTLLGTTIASVEVVEPVMVLRQPPRLSIPVPEEEGDTADDLADKMADALGDADQKAVQMYEPYRRALAAVVLDTGRAVTSFIDVMLKVGDRFPLKSVAIKEGRFEYSDAVSPQDRLLSELSHFNATIGKVSRAGGLGGSFTIEAQFSTSVAGGDAGSSLKAEVDLATGELSGELKVEKMALFPYRFFLPSAFAPTRLSFLEDAYAGFAYSPETDRFSLWGNGRVTDFNVVSPRVSRKPLEHLNLRIDLGSDEGSGLQFDLAQHRLGTGAPVSISLGKLNRFATEFTIDASVQEFPQFDLRLHLPETSVNDLLTSIPRGLGFALSGLRVGGELGFTLNLVGNSADLSKLKFSFIPRAEAVKMEAPGRTIDFNKLPGIFKHRPPTDRDRVVMVGGGDDWTPLRRISPWLVLAATTCEDGSFFRHSGFNTYQIKMSIIRDLEKGRFARGASTITMQLMKNLFLSHEKTVARKFQEIILTWLVEGEIEKARLIEIYLNVIEWGRGIYGVKQACDFYFDGLPPENLSPAQAAFLASFIPAPRPFSDKFKKGRNPEDRTKRWNRWWNRRLKIVKRIVRAMINNCSQVESKCPAQVPYCSVLYSACRDPGRELGGAEVLESLDDLFRPRVEPLGLGVGESLEF